MESVTYFLLALVPIAIVFFLMVGLRWSAKLTMAIVYVVTVLIALLV